MPAPSPAARRLADVAFAQHDQFHMLNEAEPPLCKQIRRYYDDLALGFTSCTNQPWSGAFVSWCVFKAGVTAQEFAFSARHAVFVRRAIRDAKTGAGAFHGVPIDAEPPEVGDLIQHNRDGGTVTFAQAAATSQYASHSAIVVEVGQDTAGRFALTIGGNESDSIRRKLVRLRPDGRVRQRPGNPYICVLRNRT